MLRCNIDFQFRQLHCKQLHYWLVYLWCLSLFFLDYQTHPLQHRRHHSLSMKSTLPTDSQLLDKAPEWHWIRAHLHKICMLTWTLQTAGLLFFPLRIQAWFPIINWLCFYFPCSSLIAWAISRTAGITARGPWLPATPLTVTLESNQLLH